jgi:outer membrane protein
MTVCARVGEHCKCPALFANTAWRTVTSPSFRAIMLTEKEAGGTPPKIRRNGKYRKMEKRQNPELSIVAMFGCSRSSFALTCRLVAGLLLWLGLSAGGCTYVAEQPEVAPERYAPLTAQKQWTPSPKTAGEYAVSAVSHISPKGTISTPAVQTGGGYDLPTLVDMALIHNPSTRTAWEAARAAAARYGSSRASYYPVIGVDSPSGYSKLFFESPGHADVIKQWQSAPTVEMTYMLLDFGRREAGADLARNRLIAADFAFDRRLQDVVFNVERAFYALDAAHGAVTAARRNLDLALTDLNAVTDRLNNGLATEPELLLARERVAQSRFDLANAQLLVREGQANLAVAIGVSANTPLAIQTLDRRSPPSSLGVAVDTLIAQTIKDRPDLSARVAEIRAAEASRRQAAAQWYPTVSFSANYGENFWSYTFNGPPTIATLQPQYSALMNIHWDAFTGLKRLNDDRAAEAEVAAAHSSLESAELEAIAEVWRAYYEFQSSVEKYAYGQALLAAAQEAYNANLETYRQGLSTIVELLTAQRDLANARYILIQSKADLLTANAAVIYAAGGISASGSH